MTIPKLILINLMLLVGLIATTLIVLNHATTPKSPVSESIVVGN